MIQRTAFYQRKLIELSQNFVFRSPFPDKIKICLLVVWNTSWFHAFGMKAETHRANHIVVNLVSSVETLWLTLTNVVDG